ncbi:MAG: recombinase family protein [Oscillospiraceae bacterium]|nr:recombinase family protein [Oscillospiraceae bacterium]
MAKSKMRKLGEIVKQQRAVIAKYIRVSTDRQREEGYSVEIQKERLDNYTKSVFPPGEYDVEYREYVDDGFSGGSLDRPRMSRLIEDVKNGEITHVVVLKLDRLSRSQKDTLYLIEDVFLPRGVAFISMGESFNTATAFGRAVVGILSVFAQLERENIYERTRSGMQKRVELGYWPGGGGTPFGFDYDETKGILVPNRDAETVKRVYELYHLGYAQQTIADQCGLKYERLVERILTRKTNAGVIVYNGREYPGRHEPIISMEMYERTRELMEERARRRLVCGTEHLLTGLVVCGECGAKMRYQKWGKAGDKLVCYSQQRSKPYLVRDPDCGNARPWASEVEAAVLDALFRRGGEPAAPPEDGAGERDPLRALEERRRELAARLKRLYALYAAGDDVLLDAIGELKEEIGRCDRGMEAERDRAALSRNAREARERLDSLADCWDYMTTAEKRNVLRSVLRGVTVTGDHVQVDFQY